MARTVPNESTPIINEIIEKLASVRLSTNEFNIVMAIIRKTYGWSKKEDYISGSQLAILTKMLPQHCYKILKKLEQKKIIYRKEQVIGLNKKTNEWLVPTEVLNIPEQVVPTRVLNGDDEIPAQVVEHTHAGTKIDTHAGTYKRNYKETYTKDITNDSYESLVGSVEVPEQKGDGINQIMDLFYNNINGGMNYKNKTERDAVQFFIKNYGFVKSFKLAWLAISVQGQNYMPIITTPYQLKLKLSSLLIQLKRRSIEENNIITFS